MEPLFLDYETRSRRDLRRYGAYGAMPHTEIMMVGVARGAEEPKLAQRVGEAEGPFVSWGRYDYFVYDRLERPYPSEKWVDAMALAYYLGFPVSLNGFCTAIGVENKKDPRGTRLITKYCSPDKDTGEFLALEGDDLAAFGEYCLQDVRLLQRAWAALEPFYEDWQVQWRAHLEMMERMNDRGVPIDVPNARLALAKVADAQAEARLECHKLAGFYPTQHLKAREFFGLPDTTRATLESAGFEDRTKERVRRIMLATNKAAVKKLGPMIDLGEDDGRARGTIINNGAHTGRSSSRKIQFQNMKRKAIDYAYFENVEGCIDPIAGAQENIRGFIEAPPGRVLVVADYSQQEARLLAEEAGADDLVAAFMDESRCPYREMAADFFSKPVGGIDDDERQLGKVGVLGSGYGVSGPGIVEQAVGYGLELTESTGWALVNQFDRKYPEIGEYRDELIRVAVRLIRAGRDRASVGRTELYTSGDFLTMVLPSGRELRYWKPTYEGREDAFSFMRRSGAGMFERRCWNGYFTENRTQAIGADVKYDAMHKLENAGVDLIFEVHDEVVAECDEADGEKVLALMLETMADAPEYVPSGLLVAEGSIMKRYSK